MYENKDELARHLSEVLNKVDISVVVEEKDGNHTITLVSDDIAEALVDDVQKLIDEANVAPRINTPTKRNKISLVPKLRDAFRAGWDSRVESSSTFDEEFDYYMNNLRGNPNG